MSDPMGPIFKPENKDFFVITNIGANAAFSASNKTNNTIQFTGDQWDKLRMVEPEGTQEMLDAKGKIVLAFTGTTDAAPGQLNLDADIVAKTGYKTPEGGAAAMMIANSDPIFYNPDDYDGANSNVTAASTSTKLNLIGAGWKKGSMASSQFKQALDEYRAQNESEMKKMAFDVFENVTSDGMKVEIFVEKAIVVETGTTKIVDHVTTAAGGSEYSIFTAIGDFMTAGGGQSMDLSASFQNVTGTGPVNLTAGQTGGAVAFGDSGNNQVTGTAGRDAVEAGAGNDNLDGGGGADRLEGGVGDDIIKGGSDGSKFKVDDNGNQILENGNPVPLEVWDWGDRAVFKGNKANYEITANQDGTITVKDKVGNEGTDTLSGIEILEFADTEDLLVTKTESYTTQDFATGKTIQEEFSKGTEFADVISGTDGKSIIKGKGGNDVIKGDASYTDGSKDIIEGGAGNDFIDGASRGQGVMPWENDNVAEYMAAGRRFTVEKLTYNSNKYSRKDDKGNTKTDMSDKAYLDSLITTLQMNASAIGALADNQVYFVVADSVSDADGGLGTDIITNIDELFFDDKGMRLSVFKDVWGGFIEGTDFGETITGEGVDETINAGGGADRVFGKDGADTARLGKGDDFFDGGGNTKNFDADDFLKDMGFDLTSDPNALGDFNADEFMNMDMGNAPAGGMGMGMGMDPGMSGGMGMDPGMSGGMGMDPNMNMGPGAGTMPAGGGNNMTQGGGGMPAGGDMHAGGGHMGGPSGDTVEYQGDFARFKIKTYAGNSSDLATIVQNKFSDLKDNSSMWVESKSYTVIEDTNTGSKGLGTDLVVDVEQIRFNDFSFNLAVTQNIMPGDQYWGGSADWQGTFGDDEINHNDLDTSSLKSGEKAPVNDFMMGEAGNDVLISGKGGDRLIGGVGNDIMDGGANGSTGNEWEDNDIAEYKASIDRFDLSKHTFTGKAMVLKDTNGNTVFTITATKKGTDTLGSIKRAGEDKAALTIKEGDTFYLVSDSLPEQYGGEGTDILLGIEQAQFGFDWDGNINFQVKHHVDQWGGMNGNGQVHTEGTIFGDVIDLRAGKKTTDSGFGGFNDFNDGMDIWDAGFHDAMDANMTMAAGGFDKWNWAPGTGDTPESGGSGITSLTSAYAGDSAITGTFDIYKVNSGTAEAPVYIYLAYDTANNWVAEEVKADGSNWKITYAGVAANATVNDLNTAAASDWQSWQPQSSDTAVATNKSITYDDGFVTPEKFDIYEFKSGEFLAYRKDGDFGYVHDLVQTSDSWSTVNNKKPDDQFKFADDPASTGPDTANWQPGPNDVKQDLDGSTFANEVTSIFWKGQGGGADHEVKGKWDIYEYSTGVYYAFNTEFNFLDMEVKWDSSATKYYFQEPTHSSSGHSHSIVIGENNNSGSSPPPAVRVHDSFIMGGRGDDVILAGQGRDEIEGGLGNDFIDGGSESDFLAGLTNKLATGQLIANPDTGLTKKYDVYSEKSDGSGKKWAWDGNKTNPGYFEVQNKPGGSSYEAKSVTVDNAFFNDRFSSYDRAIYTGSKERYQISEVYLKMEAGRPDFANDGSYQEVTVAAYKALSNTAKASYTKVVKIKDILPAKAGGEGTDYLLNIEEVSFEDGHEQLEIDSWGWPEFRMIQPDWSWTPSGGWDAAGKKLKSGVMSIEESWGGQFNSYDSNGWSIYAYTPSGNQLTIDDAGVTKNVYALVSSGGEMDWAWHNVERLVVLKSGSDPTAGNAQFKEATETKYTGSFRGTIKDDHIGHVNNPSKDQTDEIFGKAGDDLVVAGAGVDRIKGGTGDDTIWGGSHSGGEQWQFAGDTAFYGGSLNRYDVIQNVYVKAAAENGAVERDSSGNAVIYYDDSTAKKGLGFANGYVDGIGKEQKVGSNGVVSLDGGLVASNKVTLGVAQKVSITSTGDDSGGYFWIDGKDASGSALSAPIKLQGANAGVVTTSAKFKEITSITFKDGNGGGASAQAVAGKVKAGTGHEIGQSNLTTANGYYQAVVVVDSLSDAQGGDGSDVLIGVEGLVFGHASGGDHDWLDQVSRDSTDLTKLSVSYMAEDFMFHDWQDGDPDGISTNGSAINGALASSGEVNLGSSGRFVSVSKSGGSGTTKVKVTGLIKNEGGSNQQGATSGFREIDVQAGETMQAWDLFTKITAVQVVSGDGTITVGTADGMAEVPNYRVLYQGTDFDDVMMWDNDASFKSEVGTKFNLNQVTDMGFTGGAGDDIYYGATATKDGADAGNAADTPNIRDSYAIYNTSSKEYDITLNKDGSGNLTSVTVEHKVANSAGGTGKDTLYDINKAIFNFGTEKEEFINFLPETKTIKEWDDQAGKEIVKGLKIVSTPYDDNVTAASKQKNNKQDMYFESQGSGAKGNVFTGRDDAAGTFGKDGVILEGVFSRYDITYNAANDKWLFVDTLDKAKGGKGITVADDIEAVKFENMKLKIGKVFDGSVDGSASTKDEVTLHNGTGMHKYDFSDFKQLTVAKAAKFTVSDYGNIAADTTLTVQKNAASAVTFTAKKSGASGQQFDAETNDNTTAANLAAAINAHSDFTATSTGAVVMVHATAGGTVTLATGDAARLTTTESIGGYSNLLSDEVKDLDGLIVDKAAGVTAGNSLGTLATKTFGSVSGAGNLFDGEAGKHVTITSDANDSATTFVIAGANRKGTSITEEIKGGTAGVTVTSFNEFKTVTSVTVKAGSQATQGVIDVGYMNGMFTPGGWKSADIDGSGGNGAIPITSNVLFGTPKTVNAQTALDAANTGNVVTIKADNSIQADHTISIFNGQYNVNFTAKSSSPGGNDFLIGGSANATATNLAAKINAVTQHNPDTGQNQQVFTAVANNNAVTVTMHGGSDKAIINVPASNGDKTVVSGADSKLTYGEAMAAMQLGQSGAFSSIYQTNQHAIQEISAGTFDSNTGIFQHDHHGGGSHGGGSHGGGSNSSSDVKIKLGLHGMFQDDTLIGSEKYNDSFYGRGGDDLMWGKGEQKAEWWDTFNSGDEAEYMGEVARYTISTEQTDVNATDTITVSDSSNITANSTTVSVQKNDASAVVFTAKASGASGTQFDLHSTVNTTATNLAAAINAHSDFTASASGAVVTVSVTGGGNVFITTNDAARLTPENKWDNTGITVADYNTWAGNSNNTAPKYFTVTDSLHKLYGGDGVDTLVDIEKIKFADETYFLEIRDVSNNWDTNKTILGTSGNDVFTTYTDDTSGGSNDADYQINAGAGDDLIVGGIEPTDKGWVWGDTAVYDAQAKYFDISVKEMEFNVGGKIVVSNHGSYSANDKKVTLKKAGGSEVSFTMKQSGASGANEFNKGANADAAATNLAAKINAHADFTASASGATVSISVTGDGTMKISSDTSHLTASNTVVAWGAANGGAWDWDADGDTDSADLTLAQTLFDRFAKHDSAFVNQITVKDSRPDDAGGLGTDTLYGVEHIDFRSGMQGEMFDLEPNIMRDHDGKIIDFWGTQFGDVFNGDSGNTWVNAGAGDDVIVAGNGADNIQPGEGADYVHGGLNNNSSGGGNASWFRDEASFWDAPYARTEVKEVKVMVNADTSLMTHTAADQFIIYNYKGQAARVEDYEEDVSINETVKTFDSSTIITTGADPDGISDGDNLSSGGNLTLDGAYVTGGKAYLGTGKYVSITSTGDDTGVKFNVTGKDYYGNAQTEQITGTDGSVAKGKKIFSEITGINTDGATDGVVKTGTVSDYTWNDAFLVTDTLPGTEKGSIGLNVLVDIEAIGFSDEFLDVKPFSDSWTFTDWFTGETITESFKEGTPFDDTNLNGGSGTDTLSGNAGNDIMDGGGGGDRLKGGKGHDILKGGANGTSGDTWRDLDMAEYNGIEARYKVFTVKVNASSLTPGSQTIYDVSGQLEADTDITSGGVITLEGFDVVKKSGSASGMTKTAYIVADMLPSNMGGTGNDLLIDVEMVQFKESSIDLGLRIERNDWDGNAANGYDWVEVRGTDGADTITDWGTGSYYDTDLDDDALSLNATVGDNANVVLGGSRASGGTVTFNQAHQILITSAGDDTDRKFTITGTDSNGNAQTEEVTGANAGAATSTKSFLTVSKIAASGTDSSANIKVGVKAATVTTSEDAAADNEIRGKGGDDVIFGYAGGDRISGDGGNDFIDGGDDGATQWGWTPKDTAVYSGPAKNYTITTYTKGDSGLATAMSDAGMASSLLSSYGSNQQFVVVKDSIPGLMGGTGTDVLTNVEFIDFQDQSLPLSKEEFVDIDPTTGLEVRRAVTGTSAADKIEGGPGNDDLWGNAGDDTITGGIGGDYIKPGAGNDVIDGGADGTDQWSGEAVFDRVGFEGNYADYDIEDKDVNGVLTLTVTDTDPNGEGINTITNVEILEFADQHVFVNQTKSQIKIWDPVKQAEVQKGYFVSGSIFSDTINGSDSSDEIYGGKGSDKIYGKDGPDMIKGGQGNDTIYGGGNGLDDWGNPGDDVAVYSGIESRYTVSFYDSKGNASSSGYQSDGFVKVVDSSTDETASEGTDTLYGIEGIQFSDGYLGFKKVETFIDLDGDGKPDVGGKKGTSGADLLEGSDMDEKLEGAVGDDILSGGGGADFLVGGVGADTLVGGNGDATDTASFVGSMSNYSINTSSGKYIAVKSDGSYEKNAAGEIKVLTDVANDSATAICTAINLSSAGNLTINGSAVPSGGSGGTPTAGLTGGKYVTITSAGDDRGVKFTVTGTDENGKAMTEEITGGNAGAVQGTKCFKTVTQIAADGATAGNVTCGAKSEPTGSTKKEGVSVKTKDADGDGKIGSKETSFVEDLVFETENMEFGDGFGRTSAEIFVDDFDYDFKIDFSEILGALGNDTIKASNTGGLNSLLPGWLSDASLALADVFAANNFIDGGPGNDDIDAGAGDDFIDPGAVSGDKTEKVDGGAGNDTLRLYGKEADWEAASDASSSHGAGWKKYWNKNDTASDASDDIIVFAANIEGIEFDDIFVSAATEAQSTQIDEDGDGKIDKVITKGAGGSVADVAVATVGDGADTDGLVTAGSMTAGSAVTGGAINGAVNEAALGGQYVTIKSAADESANTFTIVGTDKDDNVITEVISGAKAAVATGTKSFKTVTSITAENNTAGNVEAGVVTGFTVQKDIMDGGKGNDVISTGDGADTLIGGEGEDFLFGGANRGTDENGEANKDVAVFKGKSAAVDLNGDGDTTDDGESADFTVKQNGFIICNGMVDASGQCILTTLDATVSVAKDDDGIGAAQDVSGAGNLTLNGALDTNSDDNISLGAGTQVEITSVGDDTGITFTVTGTDVDGNAQTEVITGGKAATATGSKVFKTVTKVAASGAAKDKVKVGIKDVMTSNEKKITDDQISTSLKPTVFSSATSAVAVTVAKGTDADSDGIEDTFEVAGAVNGVATKTDLSGSGAIALTGDEASGGVVKLMKSQNVKIKSSGDDSGVKFTVTGTDDAGNALTEVITGADGNGKTAYGTKEFKTITSITGDGATAGAGVEVGLSSFYLDMDGDNKADTLSNGKISKDINGDGDFKDPGEYEVSLTASMNVDEIFVCSLAAKDKDGDGNTTDAGEAAITNFQIFDAHEIRPVYEVTSTTEKNSDGDYVVDIVCEVEALEFTNGIMELTPQSEETVTFSLATGITELVNKEGSNFADEILSTEKSDIMKGGGGADEFVFGTKTGTDRISDFIAKKTGSDEADIIKVLKDVNGESIETAANVLSRVTSTTDGALINLGGGNTILLEGVNSDSLTAANFAVVEVL